MASPPQPKRAATAAAKQAAAGQKPAKTLILKFSPETLGAVTGVDLRLAAHLDGSLRSVEQITGLPLLTYVLCVGYAWVVNPCVLLQHHECAAVTASAHDAH